VKNGRFCYCFIFDRRE